MLLMHGWKWGFLGRVPQAFVAAQSLLDLTYYYCLSPENSARIRFGHGYSQKPWSTQLVRASAPSFLERFPHTPEERELLNSKRVGNPHY